MYWPFHHEDLPLFALPQAMQEMEEFGIDMVQAEEILADGEETGFARSEATVEKSLRIGGRWVKIVASRGWSPFFEGTEAWIIRHAGVDTHGRS